MFYISERSEFSECISTHDNARINANTELSELLNNVSMATTGSSSNRGIHFPIGKFRDRGVVSGLSFK